MFLLKFTVVLKSVSQPKEFKPLSVQVFKKSNSVVKIVSLQSFFFFNTKSEAMVSRQNAEFFSLKSSVRKLIDLMFEILSHESDVCLLSCYVVSDICKKFQSVFPVFFFFFCILLVIFCFTDQFSCKFSDT